VTIKLKTVFTRDEAKVDLETYTGFHKISTVGVSRKINQL